MKRIVLSAAVVAVGFSLVAQVAAPKPGPRKSTREQRMRQRYIRTGGKVDNLAGMKGCFQIVNCQERLKIEHGDACAARYRELFYSDFRYVAKAAPVNLRTAAVRREELKANAAVFLIDDEETPMLLVAPEERWALVNVGRLATKGCTPEKLKVRTERELSRAICMVCGTDGLAMGGENKAILTPADLEYRLAEGFTAEALMKVGDYLPKIGITPYERRTYKQACEEGWAPPPTNDVQKAIWDRAKQDKERGPTNPLVLTPPKKQ